MATYPYPVHLDLMVEACGVYSAPNTTWTLPFDAEAMGIDTVVLGSAYATSSGTVITDLTVSGSDVSAAGNFSLGRVLLGRSLGYVVQPTQAFARDQRGRAIIGSDARVLRTHFRHHNAGAYGVVVSRSGEASAQLDFEVDLPLIQANGEFVVRVGGRTDQFSLSVSSDDPRPCTITSLRYHFMADLNS